jgi:uncharacterized protein (TIGR00255 family)
MTGFGEAHRQQDGLAVAVEVRTINSRYFKLSVRTSDGYGALEPDIESVVRKQVRRATAQVNVRIDRARSAEDYQIDEAVLDSYRRQLGGLQAKWGVSSAIPLESLLALPGVIRENAMHAVEAVEVWPVVRDALEAALDGLQKMRAGEGRAMAEDLKANCRLVAASLEEVESRAPRVVEAYHERLAERLNKILADFNVTLDQSDVLKEIGLFADRSDISEETVRLRSHVEQFMATICEADCSGRKLEFLTQEMIREANTIGSKANDMEISRQVIEIKTAVERIREMIQNVE